MAARLGFLRAKCRTEAIDLAEGSRRGFAIKLATLREVGLLIKVIRLKKRGGALAGIRSEDRRIDEQKSAVVEKISTGANDLMANAQYRMLAAGTQPQMPMFH